MQVRPPLQVPSLSVPETPEAPRWSPRQIGFSASMPCVYVNGMVLGAVERETVSILLLLREMAISKVER